MAHIVATRPLIEQGLSGLRDSHTVTVCDPPDGSARSVDELIALTDGAHVLLSILADPVTERLFEARPDLRLVAQYAVGVDNIDLDAAEAHGVAVTHTPGVLTDATADMTWAVASVSTPGVCVTATPWASAASRSMLSTPTAYCATSRRAGRASNSRSVIGSARIERSTSASSVRAISSSTERVLPSGGSQMVRVCASRSPERPSSIRGRVATM